MRALICHAAEDLRLEHIETPSLGEQQVLVQVAFGGICGSDLHYYQHGGFGTVRIKQPMALGHEVSGVVEAVGGKVNGLQVGQRIAISPSRPCGVQVLPGWAAQPLPVYAFLRQRHAFSPHPGRIQRKTGH